MVAPLVQWALNIAFLKRMDVMHFQLMMGRAKFAVLVKWVGVEEDKGNIVFFF